MNSPSFWEAKFDFVGNPDEEQLSFVKGDTFVVTKQHEGGWFTAQRNGKSGYVPSNYLQKISTDKKPAGVPRPPVPAKGRSNTTNAALNKIKQDTIQPSTTANTNPTALDPPTVTENNQTQPPPTRSTNPPPMHQKSATFTDISDIRKLTPPPQLTRGAPPSRGVARGLPSSRATASNSNLPIPRRPTVGTPMAINRTSSNTTLPVANLPSRVVSSTINSSSPSSDDQSPPSLVQEAAPAPHPDPSVSTLQPSASVPQEPPASLVPPSSLKNKFPDHLKLLAGIHQKHVQIATTLKTQPPSDAPAHPVYTAIPSLAPIGADGERIMPVVPKRQTTSTGNINPSGIPPAPPLPGNLNQFLKPQRAALPVLPPTAPTLFAPPPLSTFPPIPPRTDRSESAAAVPAAAPVSMLRIPSNSNDIVSVPSAQAGSSIPLPLQRVASNPDEPVDDTQLLINGKRFFNLSLHF